MKKFEEIDKILQNQIIDICEADPYGLNPRFLYINIFNSTGDTKTLSKVFVVHELLRYTFKKKTFGQIKELQ